MFLDTHPAPTLRFLCVILASFTNVRTYLFEKSRNTK